MRVWDANANTTVTLDGGTGDDTFRVAGARIPSGSRVVIDGGAPSVLPGDLLEFDGGGEPTSYFDATGASVSSPTLPAGSVNAVGSGTVTYSDIERFLTLTGPQASAGGPYTITEGDSLSLSAAGTVVPGGQTASYEWDINGDGTFTDAVGTSPTLTWQQLVALGVNDDGTYRVAVRVTTSSGAVDVATATLTVQAARPTLSLTGPPTIDQGQKYTLTLSASDPGLDTVNRWDVNWGDGSLVETYYAAGAIVTHVYGAAAAGPETISVSAYVPDGGPYTASKAITVNTVAARVRTLGTTGSPVEGTPFTLNLTATGPGAGSVQQWTVFWGDGTRSTVTGTATSVQHTYVNDGTYTVEALVTEGDGSVHPADNTMKVSVAAVAPVLSVYDSGSTPSDFSFNGRYSEGTPNAFTLSAQEPGTDAVSEWIIDWGDGTSSTLYGPNTLVAYHTYYADGNFTLRVGSIDEDGLHVSPTTYPVTVAEVAPALTIAGPATTTEGALYTLGLSADDPGRGTIDHWTINWGDGTVQTVAGNPSALTHTYQKPGSWTISATATDQEGTYPAGNTVPVLVTAPALAPTISGLPFAFEGSAYTLNLADNNPTQYPVQGWVINWGDGAVQTIVGPATSVTHVYKDGGPVTLDATGASIASTTYQISASVQDSNGTSYNANSLTVGVYNVSPSGLALNLAKSPIIQGDTAMLNGSLNDPGTLDTHTVTITWGDGSPNTVLSLPAGVLNFTAPHQYLTNSTVSAPGGSFPISVVVTDKDGNFTSGGTSVVVLARPTVSVADAGGTYNGKPFPATGTAVCVDGTTPVSGSFRYAYYVGTSASGTPSATAPGNAGTYTVVATFTSSDPRYTGGSAQTTFTIKPATLSAAGVNFSATAGAPFTGTVATISNNVDPLGSSDYTAVISWGDGTTSFGVISGTGSTLTVTGSHTFADPVNETVKVTISNNQGNTTTVAVTESATVSNLGKSVTKGLAGTIGFWNNNNGQALLKSFNGGSSSTALANWLAATFPNLYGSGAGANNLSSKTNAQVAAFFQALFNLTGSAQAQVLATALNVYATTSSLGGSAGAAYGFQVSAVGLGAYSYSVGKDGAAFGVANNTTLNVYELLVVVNKKAANGVLYGGDATLQTRCADLLGALNQAGSIG
jgi:hypothetical protein